MLELNYLIWNKLFDSVFNIIGTIAANQSDITVGVKLFYLTVYSMSITIGIPFIGRLTIFIVKGGIYNRILLAIIVLISCMGRKA